MSTTLRIARQQLLFGTRRYASTATATTSTAPAAKAKETAVNAASKAAEILGKSGESFVRLASKTGGRTGQVLKAVESAIPPTIYYGKVFVELSKLVFRGQKMTPPDLATMQSSFKSINAASISGFARSSVNFIRTANVKDLAFVGVLGAEVLGFFTIGEIIGRRKLIGYRSVEEISAHH